MPCILLEIETQLGLGQWGPSMATITRQWAHHQISHSTNDGQEAREWSQTRTVHMGKKGELA